MFNSSVDRLDKIEETFDPQRLQQWLGAERWALVSEDAGIMQLWASPGDMGPQRQIMLPLDSSFVDYPRRVKSLIENLSRFYKMDLEELSESISRASADLFFVRLQQFSMDGTIPLKQAAEVLSSINRMVHAAATTTANPGHSHAGKRPAVVNNFMRDDLRFGHTKRGSFIMTVAARLDHEAGLPPAANEVDAPFSRRVMSTLASGLEVTRAVASDGKPTDDNLEAIKSGGASYPLVQSICEIAQTEGIQEVDFSFDWAPAGLPAPQAAKNVIFDHDDISVISAFRDQLKERHEPERETLMGRVTELRRDKLSGSQVESRAITLEAEYLDRLRKFRVELSDEEYEWAIYAHSERLPFTVSGVPLRNGRWSLNDAHADTSFLKAQHANAR